METMNFLQLKKTLQERRPEPLEIAKYFLQGYLQNKPLDFVRLRDVYLRTRFEDHEEINEAWKMIHANLYHTACIADEIRRTAHVGIGQLMLPQGYGAAEIANYFRSVFDYDPSSL